MGQSKALCEWIVETYGHREDVATRFSAVRFGNVLASSGSVIPIFRRQIERGGPVTVTHPEMTRFFMTIPEAVQLVIQAGAMAERGQVYVLDMGEPVKILDLAEKMISLSGKAAPHRDRDRVHRAGPGREDPRGARRRRRARDAERASLDPSRAAPAGRRGVAASAELETLERLVDAGDGAGLVAELGRVVSEPRRGGVGPCADDLTSSSRQARSGGLRAGPGRSLGGRFVHEKMPLSG